MGSANEVRCALQLADASNAISRATARDLLGPGRGDAMPVLYNPLPPVRDSTVAPAEPVELFYAGIASHRKRVPALAFVLRAVREQIPDARLRVAGFRWQDAPELAALCDEFGLRDNTLVMVVSEQGSAFPFAKWTCFELGLTSGMLVRLGLVLTLIVLLLASVRFARYDWAPVRLELIPDSVTREVSTDCTAPGPQYGPGGKQNPSNVAQPPP